jgi:hypothetical protein
MGAAARGGKSGLEARLASGVDLLLDGLRRRA